MSEQGTESEAAWSEADSEHFIDYGRYFVPERELQIASICRLVPEAAGPDGFHIAELCCGEGLLTRALLETFPRAHLHAYDGSQRMLEATRKLAAGQGSRLTTHRFDLAAPDWRSFDQPLQAVVSSLAIHHLDAAGKRRLYKDMATALAPGGALIVADLVAPGGQQARALAARAWDEEVRSRALELDGNLAAFEQFQADRWNFFSDPDPDPIDRPSPLYDQLRWFEEAGLTEPDVVWMKAGHAIFCGYRPAA